MTEQQTIDLCSQLASLARVDPPGFVLAIGDLVQNVAMDQREKDAAIADEFDCENRRLDLVDLAAAIRERGTT